LFCYLYTINNSFIFIVNRMSSLQKKEIIEYVDETATVRVLD